MTTLQPRVPYSNEELERLYPKSLELKQVQILLRHGERTPVSARFQNAGLPAYWPYCMAANELRDVVLNSKGSWDSLAWKRRLETFGSGDTPKFSAGPKGEIDGICQFGQLTDKGRETTLDLGQRLRNLYVSQLGFLSENLTKHNLSEVSLRATPIQRALESVQQTFTGLYPPVSRNPDLPPPTITQRLAQDETLFPNDGGCKRFAELFNAFSDRAAQQWNNSSELRYINKKIGKWMPKTSPVVKIDSHPRLSGIMDTVNSTLAHGLATRLPSEFYDRQVRDYSDRLCTEEWFAGYSESDEFRRLGIGSLIGDLTQRMVENVNGKAKEGDLESFKISLAGCHDTTLYATLAALGGLRYDRDKWPPYTSSIAFELFRTQSQSDGTAPLASRTDHSKSPWTWWRFSRPSNVEQSPGLAREPLSTMPSHISEKLSNHYVRIRYNDEIVSLPFCSAAGKHLPGDPSFCTLVAFKEAADLLTPKDWKSECRSNLGTSPFPRAIEPPPGVDVEVP